MSVADNPDWIQLAPERKVDFLFEQLRALQARVTPLEKGLSEALETIRKLETEIGRLRTK